MPSSPPPIAALLAACSMLALAGAAQAQSAVQPPPSKTSGGTRVSGLTVSGRLIAPLDHPYSESVIGADQIETLSPAPTVTAQTILNRQPSIFAYTDGPFGVRTNIFLRAFNSSQFSETYDGVAINDVFNGAATGAAENVNNVLVSTNNFEGIEIYRGINDPSVNSYNSLGGTINYLPREPTREAGGELGFSYGSFNTLQWRAIGNTGDIGGLRQTLSIAVGSSDGWLQHTSDRNTNLYYGARYDLPNNAGQLEVTGIYNFNKGNTPNNIPVPLLQQYGRDYQWPLNYEHHDIANTSGMLIVGYKVNFAPNIAFVNKAFFGHDDYQRTSFSNPDFQQSATQPYSLDDAPNGFPFWLNNPGYPNGPTYDPTAVFGSPQAGTDYHYYGYTADGYGDTAKLTFDLPQSQIVVGGNVTYAKLHSREYWYGQANMPRTPGYNNAWDEHDHRLLASAYVQDRLSFVNDRLHITLGAKWIYAATTDNDAVGFYYPLAGSVSDTEYFVSPTVGANFQITSDLSLYFAYGQNIKFPDISAFYGAFQTDGNGNNVVAPVHIKPEYVNDYEGGIKFQHGNLAASLALYREDFLNTFFTSTTPQGVSIYQNGGTSRYQGVEFQVSDDVGQIWRGDLSGYFNFAYNQAQFTSSFNSDFAGSVLAGQPLAGVPNYLVNAGLTYTIDGWRLNAEGRYVGRQFVDQYLAGLPGATQIKPYATLNLGVAKSVPLEILNRKTTLKVTFNVDNVTGTHYFNEAYSDTDYFGNSFLRGVAAAPRSFAGGMALSF